MIRNREDVDGIQYQTFIHGENQDALSYMDEPNEESSFSSKFHVVLQVLLCISETLTITAIINLIDIWVVYGYIQPTKFFFVSKSLLWIVFIISMYMRYIFVFRNNPRVLHKLIDYKVYGIGLMIIIFITYGTTLTIFTSGICLASHNQSLEGTTFGRFQMSTAYQRMTFDSTCPENKVPCLIYLTLPENSVNEMFVNFHINKASCPKSKCRFLCVCV